jgi:hypothetical protein
MMLLAAITVPWWGWLIIGAGGMLLFSGGGSDGAAQAVAPSLKLPFDPPQKLAPTTEALDHLHRVADHLEAKGLAGDSLPHIDALAALLNRRG